MRLWLFLPRYETKRGQKAFKREQIGQLDRHENEYILFLLLLIQHCIRVYTDLCICCTIVAFNRDQFNAIHKDFDKGSPEEAKDFKGHVTRGMQFFFLENNIVGCS